MQTKPLIGLLGGTSWPSTIPYYEAINRQLHYPRILLYSIDYGRIKPFYGQADRWNDIIRALQEDIELICSMGIEHLIICNNSLHRAFDAIKDQLNLSVSVYHAGLLSAQYAQQQGYQRVLLLATKLTMLDGFFARYFQAIGIEVVIPEATDIETIQTIQTQVAQGAIKPEFFEQMNHIIERYPADAVCLACTELPMVVKGSRIPVINPSDIQVKALIKQIQAS